MFDAFGKKAKVSKLYFKTDLPRWTETDYDVLGRVIQVTASNGAVTTKSYEGLTTRVTNAENQTTTTILNSLGKPKQTIGNDATAIVNYKYDAAGRLVQTTDPLLNTITNTYNLQGHKTQTDDPDMGVWEYEYNAFGELVEQTDAKGVVTEFTYDLLGRKIEQIDNAGTPNARTTAWTYDTADNGIGKLASVIGSDSEDSSYQRIHSYDTQSRPTIVETIIDDVSYINKTFLPWGHE